MSHRFTIAAVFLTALAVPAAAQQTTSQPTTPAPSTTQTDTSKKSGVTTNTSNGAIAEPMTPATATPSVTTPSVTTPSITTPATGVTAAPSTEASSTTSVSAAPAGQVQPTSGVVKVDVKVAPSLANTAKISADSAFALARASTTAGEISSAELEMTNKRLVYQVKMVKGAGASTVYVDAMTGEVVKDKKFGGLKAAVENQEEAQKLYNAKKDSAAAKKP
jgi:hypothetical protein